MAVLLLLCWRACPFFSPQSLLRVREFGGGARFADLGFEFWVLGLGFGFGFRISMDKVLV